MDSVQNYRGLSIFIEIQETACNNFTFHLNARQIYLGLLSF